MLRILEFIRQFFRNWVVNFDESKGLSNSAEIDTQSKKHTTDKEHKLWDNLKYFMYK